MFKAIKKVRAGKKALPNSTVIKKTNVGYQTSSGAVYRSKRKARKAVNAEVKTHQKLTAGNEIIDMNNRASNAKAGRWMKGVAVAAGADAIRRESDRRFASDKMYNAVKNKELDVADRFLNQVTNKWDGKTKDKDSSSMTGWL